MLTVYGINSIAKRWKTTTISILKVMFSCLQTSSRNFAILVHYYTTPGLAWDAALRMAKVTLELIIDINMYTFIENLIRGWYIDDL